MAGNNESLAQMNTSTIIKTLVGVVIAMLSVLGGIGVFGLQTFNARFDEAKIANERQLDNVAAEVRGIRSEIAEIRRDVQVLLLAEPRIAEHGRRLEQIERWRENHNLDPAHPDHPHPEDIVAFRQFIEQIVREQLANHGR